ncbi:unnamed protein product [Urochloa humidicola]
MGVVVRKSPSMVVKPSEPPTASGAGDAIIKLSSFDQPYATMPVTSFLVFEHPIHEAAETVKRALSRALVYYYPVSGRIMVAGDGGDLHIRCNGEGVEFVAAYSSHALKDVDFSFLARSPSSPGGARVTLPLHELAVHYKAEGCGPADPLLMMQVTEFSCGGFVLGVTWNHGIADGAGMAQFLQAVGEIARGSPAPSLVPVRLLDDLRPPISQPVIVPSSEPLGLACLDITVPSSLIDGIRAQLHERHQQACTMFEAVAAVLWRCRMRAIGMSSSNSLAPLYFGVNMRRHLNAKGGYYGNCVATRLVTATAQTVANADISDLVNMIRCAKDGVHDQHIITKNNQGCDDDPRPMDHWSNLEGEQELRYNTLTLSSWRNIGFEEADFGGGTPERVMCYVQPSVLPGPCCVVNLPCTTEKDGLGSNVLAACVKEEHGGAFLAEIAKFKVHLIN